MTVGLDVRDSGRVRRGHGGEGVLHDPEGGVVRGHEPSVREDARRRGGER